jgi:hypothetical protein
MTQASLELRATPQLHFLRTRLCRPKMCVISLILKITAKSKQSFDVQKLAHSGHSAFDPYLSFFFFALLAAKIF